jgi:polysaccharide deacetylase family protein (PEP-CTERM system associated)
MTGTATTGAPQPLRRESRAPGTQSRAAATRFAMSVDVEDYFQVWAFASVVPRHSWDDFDPRVVDATGRALDLFDRHGVKATFFMLAWVAERHPALARTIVARGHELASHGCEHIKVFDQSRAAFREDAARAKRILEDAGGAPVLGYRAAGFSIDRRTPWAHETLAEIGYAYSSSSHPIAHDHYGDPTAPREPHRPVSGSAFLEAPVATAEMLGRRISAAGGGWFRAAPYFVSEQLIAQAARGLSGPVIFYFHPWEIDPDQPRIAGASPKARFRHYVNLSRMESKLSRLLAARPWGRIDQALGLGC